MQYYCTLFDSEYLSRGLAMYESLLSTSSSFHLYIFAFDDSSYEFLLKQRLEFATVISLSGFETPELLAVKAVRSRGEYCWTCTPHVIRYSISKFALPNCTYLDADIYFFSDPKCLIDEMGARSLLITEHRYTPEYDQSAVSGIYCVQFVTFRADGDGIRALDWWADACLEWCFARVEEGRFGDQKYLDDWLQRFGNVHVLQNLGGGVAPWNVQQYTHLRSEGSTVSAIEISSGKNFDVVFYHFHNFKFVSTEYIELGAYRLAEDVKKIIYKPYVRHLLKIEALIKADPCFSGVINSISPMKRDGLWLLRLLKRKILGRINVHHIEKFLRY